jgi:AraC-like DNA-binding protein
MTIMNTIMNSDSFFPASVRFGEVIYPPNGTFGPRIQPTLELVWVITGEMTVWIDSTQHHAPAGTTSLLFPGHEERFAFARETTTHHRYAHIDVPDLPDAVHLRLRRAPWSISTSLAMTNLVFQAAELQHSALPTAEMLLRLVCVQMLWQFLGEAEQAAGGAETVHVGQVIERTCRYIQKHLGEPLHLDQLATVAATSPSHLIRLFRARLHTTPMAWVWQQRLARGIQLLHDTGLPIYAIAEQCGFQNAFHFSRRVRQATGSTPTDIRATRNTADNIRLKEDILS